MPEFDRATYIEIAAQLQIPKSTAERLIPYLRQSLSSLKAEGQQETNVSEK